MKKASTKYGGGIQIEIEEEVSKELRFNGRGFFFDAIMDFYSKLGDKQDLMLKVTLEAQE